MGKRVERVKFANPANARLVNHSLVPSGEGGIPRDELDVVHGQTSFQLAGVYTRVEAATCHTVVHVWPRGCNFVVPHLDPRRMSRFEHVDAHLSTRFKQKIVRQITYLASVPLTKEERSKVTPAQAATLNLEEQEEKEEED